MKRLLILGIVFWGTILAQGQILFNVAFSGKNETPPINNSYRGFGSFELDGNLLNFDFGLYFGDTFFIPTGATINGPKGVIVFFPHYIQGRNPSTLDFVGGFPITNQQKRQLLSGQWYVNITSSNHPNGEIRGPIRLMKKPTPAPVVPGRTGIFGFVDSFSARRVSSLIIISETNGNIYQANTDSQGIFQVNLVPGKYVINVLGANGGVTLDGVGVSVYAGGFSFVRLSRLSF